MNLPQQLVTDLLALSERERYELACILMDSIGEDRDEMTDDERAALHVALDESEAEVQQGRVRPASDLVAELRARRTAP